VEDPFIIIGQILTVLYFLYFFLIIIISELTNKVFFLWWTKEIKFLCANLH
jgi:hypothetical protein